MFTGFQTFRDDQLKSVGYLVDMLPVGVFRTTLEGRFVFCNRELARIFGCASAEELMELSMGSFHWDRRDRGEFFKEITEKGFVKEAHLLFKRRDGQPIWCAVTARAAYDEDDAPAFLDGTVQDVSLETVENGRIAYVHNALQSFYDYFCILDLEGRFLSINRAAVGMLGRTRKELIGKRFVEVIDTGCPERFDDFFKNVKERGRTGGKLAVRDGSDRERNLEFNAFLVTKKGRPHHISCAARDVTAKLKNDRELLRQNKFEGVLEMAGGVLHRLNQPLTIINNLVNDLLAGTGRENPGYPNLVRMREQIVKLNELAEKIGAIKKYESMDYVAGVKIVDIDKAS